MQRSSPFRSVAISLLGRRWQKFEPRRPRRNRAREWSKRPEEEMALKSEMDAMYGFVSWLHCAGGYGERQAEDFVLRLQEKPPPYWTYAARTGIPYNALLRGDFVVPLWHLVTVPLEEQPVLDARVARAVERLVGKALEDRDWASLFEELSRNIPEVDVVCCYNGILDVLAADFRAGMVRRAQVKLCARSNETTWLADFHIGRELRTLAFHAFQLPSPGFGCPSVAVVFFTWAEAEDLSECMGRLRLAPRQ
jgi:hypothetical protein